MLAEQNSLLDPLKSLRARRRNEAVKQYLAHKKGSVSSGEAIPETTNAADLSSHQINIRKHLSVSASESSDQVPQGQDPQNFVRRYARDAGSVGGSRFHLVPGEASSLSETDPRRGPESPTSARVAHIDLRTIPGAQDALFSDDSINAMGEAQAAGDALPSTRHAVQEWSLGRHSQASRTIGEHYKAINQHAHRTDIEPPHGAVPITRVPQRGDQDAYHVAKRPDLSPNCATERPELRQTRASAWVVTNEKSPIAVHRGRTPHVDTTAAAVDNESVSTLTSAPARPTAGADPIPPHSTGPAPAPTLTHLTPTGEAHMVDIGIKPTTRRAAVAISRLHFSNPTAASLIATNSLKKGDVLSVARIAGIMAAKATSTLIPLCHPLAITHLSVTCVLRHELGPFGGVAVEARVECQGLTGVEMEALTAASVAALTVYDMCKAVDRGMEVRLAKVVLKEGGRSGSWRDEAYWAKEPRRGDGKGQ